MSERGSLHDLPKLAAIGAVLLLAACASPEDALTPASPGTAAAEQQPPAKDAAVEAAPLAPVALAPGLGPFSQPGPNPQPKPAPPPSLAAAVPAEPPPASKPALAVAAMTSPEPTVAGVPVAPPPVNCPSGTIGMWSQPDIVGSAVYICRSLHRPRSS